MAWDTRDIFCEGCGYNLRDRCSGECPECGAHFDRGQADTYRYFPVGRTERFFDRNTPLLFAVFCFVMGGIECWDLYRAHAPETPGVYWAGFYLIAAFVCLVTFFLRTPRFKG